MNKLQEAAMAMIQQQMQNNPKFASSENEKAMVDAIRSGDNAAGEQLAMNILNSMGLSKEQGIQMAMQRFGIR